MTRKCGRLGWWLCWWLCGFASVAQAAAVSVTDDRGVSHQWREAPARIVSLLPSLTETLCDMGGCPRLVGVDRYSNFPAAVQALPHLGGLEDVSVERVVALKPDVVVASPSSRVIDRLEALGLAVVVLDPRTQTDVERVALKLGQLMGQPDAGPRMWRRLQAQIGAAAQSVPAATKGWRVYYEVDSSPYAAGASSFIGDLLTQMGLVNIVPTALGPFPKLNPEYVVRADPQLIMVSARQQQALPQRPGWANIQAVKQGRVCYFAVEQRDVLSRPGPRLGEAAQIMAACLRKLGGGAP
ncbi:MAG: hypothetical protein RI907_1020 [Pseudomonadota bacterium]|jgi:iron complex transport system substrate-binding protein